MARNSKGANAERDLLHLFWRNNFAAIRVAGSGRMNYPSPDVLASNGAKVLAIECKATKQEYQYFKKEQIEQLLAFSKLFGAAPLIAIKFSADWNFYELKDMAETPSGEFVIKRGTQGREFSQILQ